MPKPTPIPLAVAIVLGLSALPASIEAQVAHRVLPPVPTAAPTAVPTAVATAKPAVVNPSPLPEVEVNLLEIFPVQEPWSYKTRAPDEIPPDEATIAAKARAGDVWVNSKSGVFHRPHTTYYGKTKAGFFLPQAQAIEKGYRGVEGQ